MKVLFLTYPRIGLNRGGLQIQIEETIKGLSEKGVKIIRFNPWKNQIPNSDICHVFSIDSSLLYYVKRATALGIPVVVSPVFSAFKDPVLLTRLKVILSEYLPGFYSDLKRANIILQHASKIVALNSAERRLLIGTFKLPSKRVTVIPNGIGSQFGKYNGNLFKEKFGVENFILNVGSINTNKNQLTLINAMKDSPYTLVFVGEATPENKKYWDLCRESSKGKNIIFAGAIDNNDPTLASAYAAAKVYVLSSFSEVMPLTLYEAAASKCQLIISNRVPVENSIRKFSRRFDPHDAHMLKILIDEAMKTPETPSELDFYLSIKTWPAICRKINNLYDQVFNNIQK